MNSLDQRPSMIHPMACRLTLNRPQKIMMIGRKNNQTKMDPPSPWTLSLDYEHVLTIILYSKR